MNRYSMMILMLIAFGFAGKAQNDNSRLQEQQDDQKGRQLMETYCYACHGTKARGSERLAPPMFAIKKHYQDQGISREAFIRSILEWTSEPSAEKARMPRAVERFGIMPYQPFPQDSIKLIARYIFDHEFEHPGRHGKGHGKGHKGSGRHRKQLKN